MRPASLYELRDGDELQLGGLLGRSSNPTTRWPRPTVAASSRSSGAEQDDQIAGAPIEKPIKLGAAVATKLAQLAAYLA